MSNLSQTGTEQLDKFYYDNKIVKWFAYATMFWGIVGMLAGLTAALQLLFPALNFSMAATTFGRVRTCTHQCCDICFCRQWYFHGRILFTPAFVQGPYV